MPLVLISATLSAFLSTWVYSDPHILACAYRASSQGKLSLHFSWGNWAKKHCDTINMECQNFILNAILTFVTSTLKNKTERKQPPKTTRNCPHQTRTDCRHCRPPWKTIESRHFNRILEELCSELKVVLGYSFLWLDFEHIFERKETLF